jgi:hypothetical protein
MPRKREPRREAGALAVIFRIDAMTVARLFRATTSDSTPKGYTSRDIVVIILLLISLGLGGFGFFWSKGESIARLSGSQTRTLLSDVEKMRTLMPAVIIAYTNGNPTTEPLAHDIANVFNRAGIEPVFGFTRPDNSDQSGIIISIKDLNNPPPETEDLKKSFELSKISFKVRGFPRSGFDGYPYPQPALSSRTRPAVPARRTKINPLVRIPG